MTEENEKIIEAALSILSNNTLLSLSTFDSDNSQPCVCTTYFAFDNNFNLYIWTNPKSLHGRNIEKNPKVAINVFDSSQKWGTLLQGVQMFGTAEIVTKDELGKAAKLYLERFPDASKFVEKPEDFLTKFNDRLYKIKINKIKVFDEKIFGKEEFREITVNR